MNEIVKANGQLPSTIAGMFGSDINEELESGGAGFAVVSIRGKVWRIRMSGEENPLTDDEGNAKPSIEVVMLKAQNSKAFYAANYDEGDDAAPDCFSVDGITPDAGAQNRQCDTCAACPKNAWGSRVTDEGKKAKACPDSKRVAILPANDLNNEVFGGAMLLRIPAASLKDLTIYAKRLSEKGFPYPAVVTRLGFDVDASYPKLTFKAVRVLTEAEAPIVIKHKDGDVVKSIMDSSEHSTDAAVAAPVSSTVDIEFEQPPEPTPPPTPKKKVARKKKAVVKEPDPVAEEAATEVEKDLDDILSGLE